MQHHLDAIRLKLQALGFTQPQVDSIVNVALAGKLWEEMSTDEKVLLLGSLDKRIDFYRQLVKAFHGPCYIM